MSGVRVLQLVHGYPPRERAGTEVYAARLADRLRALGHDVHTLAATQRPGAPMYTLEEEPGLGRVVQNAPYAGIRAGERDRAVEHIVEALTARTRPHLILVQHLRGLSCRLPVEVPVAWMLHDAWAWCPAGGLLLRDGAPCPGPGVACPACASRWAKDGLLIDAALGIAGRLSRVVPAEALHRAYRRLPASLRATAARGSRQLSPQALASRDANIRALAARAKLYAPSTWLAEAAAKQGFPRPEVLPHGIDAPRLSRRDGPFVFLGTIAPHKGPALVVEAHRRSGMSRQLIIHGPPGPDAAYNAAVPSRGPVDDPFPLLAGARALILGSIWPENAPLVVLEARAMGCPVVAPAIGGLPEIVTDGVDGWLYPPGDLDALAACLRRIEQEPSLPVTRPPSFADHVDRLVVSLEAWLSRSKRRSPS